jgi:hypothetical protein
LLSIVTSHETVDEECSVYQSLSIAKATIEAFQGIYLLAFLLQSSNQYIVFITLLLRYASHDLRFYSVTLISSLPQPFPIALPTTYNLLVGVHIHYLGIESAENAGDTSLTGCVILNIINIVHGDFVITVP